MSKAILISIKPKWVAKILNGEKTIEIRKTMPKCDLPIDVYIYATKEGKLYDDYPNMANGRFKHNKVYKGEHNISGKVVAKFTLNKVEEYINGHNCDYIKHNASSCLDFEKVLKPSCVIEDELYCYAEDLHFYAWHIDNLEIFDEPKELSGFRKPHTPSYEMTKPFIEGLGETYTKKEYLEDIKMFKWVLTKAPQNFCYVEIEE